jgi:hypothetical protein
MDDILDYEKGKNRFVDYLFLQEYQLAPVVEVLTQNDVLHMVKEVKNLDDIIFIPTPTQTLLNRSDYIIQVQKSLHQKVDYIMAEHPELLEDSEEVRKLFLANSLDEKGLIDVLLFPDEWLEDDNTIAIAILARKGITIPVSEYDQRRVGRDKDRASKLPSGYSNKNTIFAIVALIIVVIYILSGASIL